MMLSDSQRQMLQTKGVVVGRVLMGLLFFSSGVNMLLDGPANTAAYFDSLDIPLAGLVVWLVIILKLGAGGAVIVGKHVGCAAALLAIFTLLTIVIAHRSFDDVNLFKNLAIVGGLLYVMAHGAGSWNSSRTPSSDSVPPSTADNQL